MKGLVLDLRDNPGGLLDQAVKITESHTGFDKLVRHICEACCQLALNISISKSIINKAFVVQLHTIVKGLFKMPR